MDKMELMELTQELLDWAEVVEDPDPDLADLLRRASHALEEFM